MPNYPKDTVFAGKIAPPPRIPVSKLGGSGLYRCRLLPVINHSTLAYVCHSPGSDCHQSSTIPPWPMCVTIQGQTATSHQPFHPGLCGSLSRDRLPHYPGGRLPPVINHSTLAYVCHYPGDRLPPVINHSTLGLCVSLSRGRLPPVINHSTLAYVCHYPGADCHQSSTIPPWPMCVTIQGQTTTSHQPFHPGLCVSLSRGRLPPVINHSTLAYVCHYPEPSLAFREKENKGVHHDLAGLGVNNRCLQNGVYTSRQLTP